MKLKVAQVVGLNTDQKAAQVIYQARDQETFLALVTLTCDDAFSKGRQILSELADFYFDLEGKPAEKLTATFKDAQSKLSPFGEFDILMSTIFGKVLYLQGQGQVEVFLKRNDQLSPLLSVGSQGQLISGFLQGGDRLLFSSRSLTDFLGEGLLNSMQMPIDTFEEEISSQIGQKELEDQALAGLALEVEVEEETAIPSITEEEIPQEEQHYPPQYPQVGPKNFFLSLINPPRLKQAWAFVLRIPPKTNRGRLILALILLAVVSLGSFLKYQDISKKQKQAEFAQTLQQARDDFSQALGLATLNPKEAKSKLDLARGKLDRALAIKPKDQPALDLKNQIEQQASTILQQFNVSEFPLFLDLDLIKKDFKAKNLSLSAGKVLILDSQTKTLVLLDISKKSHQILAGEKQLGDVKLASLNGNLAFSYSSDKGVLRTDVTTQKQVEVSQKDKDFGEIKDMAGFASNVYLLDTQKNQIWKYLPTAEGYSDKREYLSKGTKVDFTGSLRMQIESSIYVLKSGGEMLRFTRGEKDNFSYGGLDIGVKDPKSFFVSSETDNLYLLDSGNSRLLILTKTGSYKGQITGEKFAQASDLVVDEKGKKVYLLEGSKIFQVDLK